MESYSSTTKRGRSERPSQGQRARCLRQSAPIATCTVVAGTRDEFPAAALRYQDLSLLLPCSDVSLPCSIACALVGLSSIAHADGNYPTRPAADQLDNDGDGTDAATTRGWGRV